MLTLVRSLQEVAGDIAVFGPGRVRQLADQLSGALAHVFTDTDLQDEAEGVFHRIARGVRALMYGAVGAGVNALTSELGKKAIGGE